VLAGSVPLGAGGVGWRGLSLSGGSAGICVDLREESYL